MKPRAHLHLDWRRRLPMVLQTEAAECALASLAMVAQHFGYTTSSPFRTKREDR